MGVAIISQDMVSICLVCANGELCMSVSEVLRKVEEYQEQRNRHFGITTNDFRNVVFNLLLDAGYSKEMFKRESSDSFDTVGEFFRKLLLELKLID